MALIAACLLDSVGCYVFAGLCRYNNNHVARLIYFIDAETLTLTACLAFLTTWKSSFPRSDSIASAELLLHTVHKERTRGHAQVYNPVAVLASCSCSSLRAPYGYQVAYQQGQIRFVGGYVQADVGVGRLESGWILSSKTWGISSSSFRKGLGMPTLSIRVRANSGG